jgi:hypothetical protein
LVADLATPCESRLVAGARGASRAPLNDLNANDTIAGYEAIHMIRKGQACWSAAGAKVGLLHRFIVNMFGLEV